MQRKQKFTKTGKIPTPIPFAVFFDFDEVLHRNEEVDEEKPFASVGFAGGKLIGVSILKNIIILAKKHSIPLFIVTSRAPNRDNQIHISTLLKTVDGFNDNGVGGFHEDDIFCLGVEKRNKKGLSVLIGMCQPKVKQIEEVHQARFPHLPKNQVAFIDDDKKHRDPAAKAGYMVIEARPGDKTLAHLQRVWQLCQAVAFAKVGSYGPSSSTFFHEENEEKGSASIPASTPAPTPATTPATTPTHSTPNSAPSLSLVMLVSRPSPAPRPS